MEHCGLDAGRNSSHPCTSSLSPRGLRFIQVFLQSLVNGEKDESNPNLIRVNITKGYELALKRYHGWLVQQFFKVSSESCHQSSAWVKSDRIFQVLICPIRQPCSLLRTSQIFWGCSPRARTSRKRSPRTRSGNSSSTSLPQLTPFTRCTAGWMLILITKCECLCRLIHGHLYDFPFFHYFSLLFKRRAAL